MHALEFLCSPAARAQWAPERGTVQRLQTHMSWVLRSPRHVLKLKKPLRSAVLDFSTPEARLHDCCEEERLNARLAPGVVLGVWTLHATAAGLRLIEAPQGGPTLVEAAVYMRRLPDARMLDHRLRAGTLADDAAGQCAVDALARALAAFYRAATPVQLAPAVHLARLAHELAIDRSVLGDPRGPTGLPEATPLLARAQAALAEAGPVLDARVQAGGIVDGHGDLRPEHVCLLARPLVIDALEFNAALRAVDPLDELVGLALECERLGAPWIGPRLLAGCAAVADSAPKAQLVALYRQLHALRRARLAMAHLQEPMPRTPARWRPRARAYLRLASWDTACESSAAALTT